VTFSEDPTTAVPFKAVAVILEVEILDRVPDGPVSAPVRTSVLRFDPAATLSVDEPSMLTFPVVTLIRSVTIPLPIVIVPDGFANMDEIMLEVEILDMLALALFELVNEAVVTLSNDILARGVTRAVTFASVTFARGLESDVHKIEFKFDVPVTFADVLVRDVEVTFVVVKEFETNRLTMDAVLFTVSTLLKV
jgi:hypothetical protein